MFAFRTKVEMPTPDTALPGRPTPIPTARLHFVNGHALKGPYPEGSQKRCSGSAAFGAPSTSSGNWAMASM